MLILIFYATFHVQMFLLNQITSFDCVMIYAKTVIIRLLASLALYLQYEKKEEDFLTKLGKK